MKAKLHPVFLTLALLAGVHQAEGQGTAFMYQGQLQNNSRPIIFKLKSPLPAQARRLRYFAPLYAARSSQPVLRSNTAEGGRDDPTSKSN